MAKVTNITAYRINDIYYFRKGKYNGKKKKRLQEQIKNGEDVPIYIEENSTFEKRRKKTKTSRGNSLVHGQKEEEVKKWQQLTLGL
tara:strand:- start:10527 stop:10784 length:258 start_codon:yes stop_codon:yes gene_type:complete